MRKNGPIYLGVTVVIVMLLLVVVAKFSVDTQADKEPKPESVRISALPPLTAEAVPDEEPAPRSNEPVPQDVHRSDGMSRQEMGEMKRAAHGKMTRLLGNSPPPELSLRNRFSRTRSLSRRTRDYDHAIALFQAFAQTCPGDDLEAEAHLEIVDILIRKKDLEGAITKTQQIMESFPQARKAQYPSLGEIPLTMWREWREYVEQHPILVKDYGWYKLAHLYVSAGRLDDALTAYDHILASVEPEKLPDTRNKAILTTFRLHQRSSLERIALLRKMERKDDADRAALEHERLYPKAAWKQAQIAADEAFMDYVEESKKTSE